MELDFYTKEAGEDDGKRMLHTDGDLTFSVEHGSAQAVQDALQAFRYPLGSLDFWRHREAVEALSVVDDPVVVPFLISVIRCGEPDLGLQALARFSEEKMAVAEVIDLLSVKDGRDVALALKQLAAWGYELQPEQLQLLSQRDDPHVRWGLKHYRSVMLAKRIWPLLQ
jgi:hypothetical protein